VILEREIAPPLVLRSKRKGDRLLLERGTKTLKALFVEWKVPEGDRWKVPVLADRRGVLAVLGGPAGRGAAVRAAAEQGPRESQREAAVAVRIVKGNGGAAARPRGGRGRAPQGRNE
jgi:tRNA(Ile)-lysidine synthetase-like protein